MIPVHIEPNLNSWRKQARELLTSGAKPESVLWNEGDSQQCFDFGATYTDDSLDSQLSRLPVKQVAFCVPKDFLTMAKFISCHKDPERWNLLYRILFRLKNESSDLLKIATDPDIQKAQVMMKSVTHDIHKMHAFVRFKKVVTDQHEVYIAWHRPEHHIVEEATPFFVRRFGDKPWCIMTPDQSAFWDLKTLNFTGGVPQHLFHIKDDFDELWKTYYSSIFNPARIKIKAMKAEMAPKYWSTLPEAALIHDLIRQAPARLEQMAKNQNTHADVPRVTNLSALNSAMKNCKSCPLFATAHQVVPGEGPQNARLMIVGEQPGDNEDRAGKPFIGPAGEVLNEKLQAAKLIREEIYLTNAVKHFKFTREGKLRKHSKASGNEMHACRPWLEQEIKIVKPKVIVALGLTAATSLLGRLPNITKERGKIIRGSPFAEAIIISWHPAAILRSTDIDDAILKKKQLGEDLELAGHLASEQNPTDAFHSVS